jgi:hypothetical protein
LFPEVGGADDQDAPLALGPFLGQYQARFNRLPETDFVGEYRAFSKRGFEREKCGLDLMWIQSTWASSKAPANFSESSAECRRSSS